MGPNGRFFANDGTALQKRHRDFIKHICEYVWGVLQVLSIFYGSFWQPMMDTEPRFDTGVILKTML